MAEIGDFSRFEHPRKLMAYLGLVPSEYSSGDKTVRGSITKTGNAHARRLLTQAVRISAIVAGHVSLIVAGVSA